VSSAARGPAGSVFEILTEFLEEDSRIDQLESIRAESLSGIMACLNADEEEMCAIFVVCVAFRTMARRGIVCVGQLVRVSRFELSQERRFSS